MENCCKTNTGKKTISILTFLALVGIAYFVFTGNKIKDDSGLPSYALINDNIKEAYLFATENPSALDGVKCHCGCMKAMHNGRIHVRGLLDCFKKENEDFDSHAAGCAMCINDALEVKRMLDQNKTKEEIKNIIDRKYN